MGNRSIVQQPSEKQYTVTIPKGIAQAMRLKKGDEVDFIFDRGDVIMRKV